MVWYCIIIVLYYVASYYYTLHRSMKQTDSNDGRRGDTSGGFYFVRVINLYSELFC